ncbi:hypothetical protein [Sphingomonas sp. Leaf343]|uniref:hypothetical protein n=1 Tax=Sphingomonas sp. Leaf343 TaxID=1736345 RepID=UPI0006FC8F92|nr:hypothetical protein [Sphingomonas sp. Leaf343]KQR83217.1 hypothetical protein ASG07_09685 [Sphingomonas sp. Leaf343]
MTETPNAEHEPNEILAAAREAKDHAAAAAEKMLERKNWQLGKIGLGVGIGSAAVAAAVLFANRQRGGK